MRPVRVIATTGSVRDPQALLKPGGGVTVLNRPAPLAPPSWPAGTTASASSAHAPNGGDNGTPTTYDAANAIDGNPSTFWNDDTEGAYPDVLTITAPQPVTLSGITLLSNSDGVPVDFTVDTWDGTQWHNAATITGNSAVRILVPFTATVSTPQVRITVTQDQNTPQGEFTRINEVCPALVEPVVPPSVTIDFGINVVGYPNRVRVGVGQLPGGAARVLGDHVVPHRPVGLREIRQRGWRARHGPVRRPRAGRCRR